MTKIAEVGRGVVVEDAKPITGNRILVTNDDGVESPGLAHIAIRLAEKFDVVVAAPDGDRSGSGTGIGTFDASAGVDVTEADIGPVRAYSINGPPGLAVMMAALGAFGLAPDLVVSGINAGINTGHSIIHSGTVGAALTARTFGAHGLAISLARSERWEWEAASAIGVAVVEWMLTDERSPMVLNLNVPGLPLERILGLRWAELDGFGYFRVAIPDLEQGKVEFEVSSSSPSSTKGADSSHLAQDYATMTLLGGVESRPPPDLDPSGIWQPT